VRYLPLWGKQPLDYQVPWFSFGAIRYLEKFLQRDMTVLEWGGGGSTLWLARRVRRVICVESDHAWANRFKQALAGHDISNVEVVVRPYSPNSLRSFAESGQLECADGSGADVYIVDGEDGEDRDREESPRPACFRKAEELVRPGGAIVVDDSYRYTTIRNRNRAVQSMVFQSPGPCRYGVTSTDIFLY
jgi:predicted O-methyltransferase YrrM